MEELTAKQAEAIKKFWAKGKSKGWKYGQEVKVEGNQTVVITMIDPSGHKHWLQVNTQGEVTFAPVTMSCY